MNKSLKSAIIAYSKGSSGFTGKLSKYSQRVLIKMFKDLLTLYINDLNSSTIREMLTLMLAGYEYRTGKIGYNGYKMGDDNKTIECEVKPKNIITSSNAGKKLRGDGNFTDYNWKRFDRHKAENLNMLVSGFIDGKIIYIFEFPFNLPSFVARLKEQLEKKFPGGDVSGSYLRSADFSHAHYADDAKLVYLAKDYAKYKEHIVGPLYKKLEQKNGK